nr:hypothetical protein [Tanacetum cinerariifolium]
MVKVKENALDVEIQIISSENVQSHQEAIIKKLLLEEHGVIVAKTRKKRLKTKLDYLTKFDPKSYEGVFLGYSQNSKACNILNKHIMKVKESLNVTFNETPPPSKTSPLEDDDLVKEEAIENKLDENGVVSRNKARLVAQGYNQQEGINYDETYAPVARLESIRIVLAYACALDFKLFQMDVKSTFLNDFINEEVYVAQPPGFIDFAKPNHVYRLKKALYGLKQAPKAWYDRLKAFLIKHDYIMGMVDNTLFNKKKDPNLIIVQIYVDDIIFGSTCQEMCDDFAKIMHDEFEMKDSKPMKTPISTETKLTKDVEGESVDNTKYREDPKISHLEAVKRILRYVKGTMHLGLWYLKGSGIETIVYTDFDHRGDYKQTALAISTTEAEYVSAGMACQQALWMKQALVDYGI